MEKKIIAIVVALVLVVTAVIVAVVISNNQREYIVDDDGVAHWIYKNEEGSTVLNDKGEIVVYAVDRNGKRQKDENGEYVTAAIDFPRKLIEGNTLETPDYKLSLPEEWELRPSGIFVLKENENVKIKVNVLEQEAATPIDTYFENLYKDSDEYIAGLKEEYPIFEEKTSGCTITLKKLDCRVIEYRLAKEEGKTDLYTYGIYFSRGTQIYHIGLTYLNGSYEEYGKDIDLISLADANFVVKDIKAE